jgi:FkbM family methyltransferase
MSLCTFETSPADRLDKRCTRCGRAVRTADSPDRIRAACGAGEARPRGLGDALARFFSRLGLHSSSGCGCWRRREWLNRLVPFRLPGPAGAPLTAESQAATVLIRFPHGLGDAVQLTTVLLHARHYQPQWRIDVACKPGAHSLFSGLAQRSILLGQEVPAAYDRVIDLAWPEPDQCYADSPSTKAERCLREFFHWQPIPALCRYQVEPSREAIARARQYLLSLSVPAPDGRFPVVLFHYQGNSAARNKSLSEPAVRMAVREARALGLIPVVLDWDRRSGIVADGEAECPAADHPLWRGTGTGDGAVLAGLIRRASLFVGIDSGPGHVAGAVDTPALIVWTRHHPVHYFGLADHVLHVVPWDHPRNLRGNPSAGRDYFNAHYHFREYRSLAHSLPQLIRAVLRPSADGLCFDLDHHVRRRYRQQDRVIVEDVYLDDCYQVGRFPPDARRIVDVGAHIGSFARRVHQWNPRAEIVCVEANPGNIPALVANCPFATILPAALTYEPGPHLLLDTLHPAGLSTGGSLVVRESAALSLAAASGPEYLPTPLLDPPITLEDIFDQTGWPEIDVLKLDCEGCELSLLAHSPSLDRVRLIVGEYHEAGQFEDLVRSRLPRHRVTILRSGEPGLFWAEKT